ncbi:hypothetical protein J3A83DRAFT_4086427 [Scleroderma citrinum]
MLYPQSQPDPCVFEAMTEEYSAVSTLGTSVFTPLSSSEALASLVRKGDFKAADTLRQEMIAHHIPIIYDGLYQRAALHAIRERRTRLHFHDRLETFTAWMTLVPDRSEKVHSFYAVRQHIFRSMDHLNMRIVHQFGLVLVAKGYYCNSAMLQVVATLAQYASPSITESFLQTLDAQCRKCFSLSSADGLTPEHLMEPPFNVAIKKNAIVRRTDAALRLVKMAHERGVRVSDETLAVVLKHSTERQRTADTIHTLYPAYSITPVHPVHPNASTIITEFGTLPSRLRALCKAFRSPTPPPPYVLLHFVMDYSALGRFHAIALLRKCAFRHSFRSAAAWVLAEMLYHRGRKEHLRTLAAFSKYFQFVGVPRKTILALLRGPAGKSIRPRAASFGFGVGMGREVHFPPYPVKQRLWPSPSHTALAWEALVMMSNAHGRKRLYALLLQLVEQAKRSHGTSESEGCENMPPPDAADASDEHQEPSLILPLTSFDAAHFSPFIKTHAARGRPDCAAGVVADMTVRGIQPGILQWGMVARGYAQNGDAALALKILDQLEAAERNQVQSDDTDASTAALGESVKGRPRHIYQPSDGLLGTITNVLRGFILARDVEHAREVEARLLDRLRYQFGGRPTTDSTIEMLRALEAQKP